MFLHARNLVRHHLFADDKQLYRSGKISEIDSIRHQLCCCVTDIRDWRSSRRLQLNALKTELQWFGSRANLRKLLSWWPDFQSIMTLSSRSRSHEILASTSTISWRWSNTSVVLSAQQWLLSVWSRHSCSADSCSDHCNAVLAGLPASTIRSLQRVQNITLLK